MAKKGLITLFGSGEISSTGRKIHDMLFSQLSTPVKVAILETPAGFQPNVEIVSKQIKDFFEHRLQNYQPQVSIIKARQKGSIYDTNDPKIVESILNADYIFAGPGSPTYMVKNLTDSVALKYLIKRHRQGAFLSMSSAAALAMGHKTMPVYEIFKAGHNLYWEDGLNYFGQLGLNLVIITHWNNKEGGIKLDTSHCFMGEIRFNKLIKLLNKSTIFLGIDEMTACIFNFESQTCEVFGKGGVSVIRNNKVLHFEFGSVFPFSILK